MGQGEVRDFLATCKEPKTAREIKEVFGYSSVNRANRAIRRMKKYNELKHFTKKVISKKGATILVNAYLLNQ